MDLSIWEAIIRLLGALFLGALVGLERELSMHPAGLRTHILVCMGSAVFTILSVSSLMVGMGVDEAIIAHELDYRVVRDPARIAAQIVTGIGFIGGGAVLRHGATVRGLTTAASLWMVASVGMLVGSGNYVLSIVATVATLIVLFLLGKVGRNLTIKHQRPYNRLKMLVTAQPMHLSNVQAWVDRHFEGHVLEVKTTTTQDGPSTLSYTIDVSGGKVDVNEVSRHVNGLTGVLSSGIRMYYHTIEEDH